MAKTSSQDRAHLEKPFPAQFSEGDRVALSLSYDGSSYRGWQSQRKPQVLTVQEELERALSSVANSQIVVQCAGRTDAGVHASHQVVHFDTPVARSEKAWVSGTNSQLPPTIAVEWAKPVPQDFNARFSATARRYRYIILNTAARSAILPAGLTWVRHPLNYQSMHLAAQSLLGELDFTSYRAAACQSRTPMRNVHFVEVTRRGDLVIIDIQANAFLHHMVRNIAGVLIEIGSGNQPIEWAEQILLAKDRSKGAATASPQGLYLVDVLFPDEYNLPENIPGPPFVKVV